MTEGNAPKLADKISTIFVNVCIKEPSETYNSINALSEITPFEAPKQLRITIDDGPVKIAKVFPVTAFRLLVD